MSGDGIWQIGMLGAYGWESVSTAFLEDGTYKAASVDHYSVGSYDISGNKVKISANYVTHGQARTLFGAKNKKVHLNFEGELQGDRVFGLVNGDKGNVCITLLATRLAELL